MDAIKIGDIVSYDHYEAIVIAMPSVGQYRDSTFIFCESSTCFLDEKTATAYNIDPKYIDHKFWIVSSTSVKFKSRPKNNRHTYCQICNHG